MSERLTAEERVMDAAWGRLEAPETMERLRAEARARAVPHIVQEGARFHVLWWTNKGTHCTEPRCEVNLR